ncbi:centrobin isoform X2 [Brienomyrus brachyistius]|uniref:centrobin isoform X2 n=1 Tax=Brienomyrus brachyistius TaxID=42636 RepID=UPI0020B2D599|nr:centrobin isoform X2 [Brienomyrus brachyistius]
MSAVKNEDLLSDVEPLIASPSASPPPSFLPPSLAEACTPSSSRSLPEKWQPSLAHSWPTSPLSTLSPSSQVTARLYASLKSSEKLGVAGLAGRLITDPTERPRQVTFSLSSPSLTSDISAAWMKATPAHFLGQLEEPEGAESSTPASLSPNIGDPAEGAARAIDEDLELGELAEKMSHSLQTSVDSSSASALNGREHIQDMESVRGHLQSMLRAGQETSEQERATSYVSGFPQLDTRAKDDESFDSDATSHLLSAPALASPTLSFSGLDDLFPRYSRLRSDEGPPMSAEGQVLQDCLDRERTRRKHCERQIRALQNKALQSQQQLALAASADRKKNVMIEQLDKTLAKVVAGWRRHEQEQSARIGRLHEEKEAVQKTQAKQQEASLRLEQSLSQAVETLDREQKHGEELRSTNQLLERQLANVRARLEEQGRRRKRELEETRREVQEAHGTLSQHREAWASRERELEERLALQAAELDREKAGREHETLQLKEAQQELRAVQARLQQLDGELEEACRERDAARMDRALEQARSEAQRSHLEVELKLSLEQQVTERLVALQKENEESTASLREQHRKQLLDLGAHQERELSKQMAEFRAELQGRDDRHRRLVEDYERRLALKQEEVQSLESSKRKLEAQRAELVSRLQELLRSHWTEALRLLANQNQVEGPPSPPPSNRVELPVMSDRELDQAGSLLQRVPGVGQCRALCDVSLIYPVPAPPQDQDPPQPLEFMMSKEIPHTRLESPPHKARGSRAPQSDLSSLFNHSSSFCPLEPQLDDTAITAGGCDLEELCEKPLAKEKHAAPGLERGLPWKGRENRRPLGVHDMESGREECSGDSVMRDARLCSGVTRDARLSFVQGQAAYHGDGGRLSQSGYCAEGGVSLGVSTERDRHLGGSGHSAPSGREVASQKDTRLDLSMGSVLAQGGHHAGLEHYRSGLQGYSSWGPKLGESGGPRSNWGALESSQYNTALGSGLERVVIPDHCGTSQYLERSTENQPGIPAQTGRPGEQDEYRQAQLQYYISKLLDRCPGEPLDLPVSGSEHHSVASGSGPVETGLQAPWEGEGDPQLPAPPVVTLSRPLSLAVTKTKLGAPPPYQQAAGRPESGPLPQGDSDPTKGSLAQVTRLLSECQAQPDSAMPSLEKLLAQLLSAQADRTFGSEGRESSASMQHLQQALSQTDHKEGSTSAMRRRSQSQRPTEGGRSQGSRGRRGGPQAHRASVTRGSAWR